MLKSSDETAVFVVQTICSPSLEDVGGSSSIGRGCGLAPPT